MGLLNPIKTDHVSLPGGQGGKEGFAAFFGFQVGYQSKDSLKRFLSVFLEMSWSVQLSTNSMSSRVMLQRYTVQLRREHLSGTQGYFTAAV